MSRLRLIGFTLIGLSGAAIVLAIWHSPAGVASSLGDLLSLDEPRSASLFGAAMFVGAVLLRTTIPAASHSLAFRGMAMLALALLVVGSTFSLGRLIWAVSFLDRVGLPISSALPNAYVLAASGLVLGMCLVLIATRFHTPGSVRSEHQREKPCAP